MSDTDSDLDNDHSDVIPKMKKKESDEDGFKVVKRK